jgi:hypothetical protein
VQIACDPIPPAPMSNFLMSKVFIRESLIPGEYECRLRVKAIIKKVYILHACMHVVLRLDNGMNLCQVTKKGLISSNVLCP